MKTTTVRRKYDLSGSHVNVQICCTGPLNTVGRVASDNVWKAIQTVIEKFPISDELDTFELTACALLRLIIDATQSIVGDISFGVILEGEIEVVYVGTTS